MQVSINEALSRGMSKFSSDLGAFLVSRGISSVGNVYEISSHEDITRVKYVPYDKLYKYKTCIYQGTISVNDTVIEMITMDLSKEIELMLNSKIRIDKILINEFQILSIKNRPNGITTNSKFSTFVKKYCGIEDSRVIEKLNNEYLLSRETGRSCKIISGADIAAYYNEECHYEDCGTLGNSCMKGNDCSDYFGLYTENTQVKLAVCLEEGGVAARALIWDNKFSDRIYYCNDSYRRKLQVFLREQGYIDMDKHYGDDGWREIAIQLDHVKFDDYPFLDHFYFLNRKTGVISNTTINDPDVILGNTDGTVTTIERIRDLDDCNDYHVSNNRHVRQLLSYAPYELCTSEE